MDNTYKCEYCGMDKTDEQGCRIICSRDGIIIDKVLFHCNECLQKRMDKYAIEELNENREE